MSATTGLEKSTHVIADGRSDLPPSAHGDAASARNERRQRIEQFVDETYPDLHAPENVTLRQRIIALIESHFVLPGAVMSTSEQQQALSMLRRKTGGLLGQQAWTVLQALANQQSEHAARRGLNGARDALAGVIGAIPDDLIELSRLITHGVNSLLVSDPATRTATAHRIDEQIDGSKAAIARFFGIDPNSQVLENGHDAVEAGLLLASLFGFGEGALTLVKTRETTQKVRLALESASALRSASLNPEAKVKLAIVAARDPKVYDVLPEEMKRLVRETLKKSADEEAVGLYKSLPRGSGRLDFVKSISDQMYVYEEYGYTRVEYGNRFSEHFIDGRLDPDGVLFFEFHANPRMRQAAGGGADMFKALMHRLHSEGKEVKFIQGTWERPPKLSDNYAIYEKALQRALAKGIPRMQAEQQAAQKTVTGQLAAQLGYTKVEKYADVGTAIYFRFARPTLNGFSMPAVRPR